MPANTTENSFTTYPVNAATSTAYPQTTETGTGSGYGGATYNVPASTTWLIEHNILWLPFVLVGLGITCYFLASFLHYHYDNKARKIHAIRRRKILEAYKLGEDTEAGYTAAIELARKRMNLPHVKIDVQKLLANINEEDLAMQQWEEEMEDSSWDGSPGGSYTSESSDGTATIPAITKLVTVEETEDPNAVLDDDAVVAIPSKPVTEERKRAVKKDDYIKRLARKRKKSILNQKCPNCGFCRAQRQSDDDGFHFFLGGSSSATPKPNKEDRRKSHVNYMTRFARKKPKE